MKIYCDGASYLDKGGCGAIFYDREGEIYLTLSVPISPSTNNIAELRAVEFALEAALCDQIFEVDVYTDSMLAVMLINRRWRCHKDHLKPILSRILELVPKFSSFSISHVYRDFNQEADELSKKALKNILTKNQTLLLSTSEELWRKRKEKKRKKEKKKKRIQ